MHLQLWNRDSRNTNAGDDASIVYHEYTHGLSGRLIIDAAGAGALNSPQAGAMGEGWSDFYAKDFLNPTDTARQRRDPHGRLRRAEHPQAGARLRPGAPAATARRRRRVGAGGFTYGDYGKIWFDGPEIHADGEIWAQTLWDLPARDRLGRGAARDHAARCGSPRPSRRSWTCATRSSSWPPM